MKQYPILVAEHDSTGGRFIYTTESKSNATLSVDDGRTISRAQQRKAHAMIDEVDDWCGNYIHKVTENQLKEKYMHDCEDFEEFSLSDCSMAKAKDFIDFLISFCLTENVPFASETMDLIQGCYGWEMHCLENRVCCICRKHADIAHITSVGIGRNRDKISHIGAYIMPLCRECHVISHTVGTRQFMLDNHIKGIKVTPEIAKMLKLGNWNEEKDSEYLGRMETN